MPPEDFAADDPRAWLERAAGNLRIAHSGLAGVELAELCFNAHQAAEKAVKGVLLHLGVVYPRIHDLRQLFRLVRGAGADVPDEVVAASRLTDYAVMARYPVPPQHRPTEEDHAEAVSDAERVLRWAERLIGHSTGI